MGANPTGRAGRHGHLVVELRIRGELTAAVSRSATEAVESHGTRLISPCRGLGTNSKFEVVIPPRILRAVNPSPLPWRHESPDGHELTFQVNYLAGFLLARRLLPLLKRSALARIVDVASAGQAPIDFIDVMLERRWDGWQAYC